VDQRVWVQGRAVESYPELPPEAERGSLRRITVIGEEILAKPCRDVTRFDSALSGLVDDLFATLAVAEGAGLAANQIDVDLRVFVWDCPDEYGVRHVGHIVNPVLDELPAGERRLSDDPEGCLSVPGPYAKVPRPDYARVRGQDKDGNPLVIEGRGYFARCLQHETDHLSGSLYVDRLPHRKRKTLLRDMAAQQDTVFARRTAVAQALGKVSAQPPAQR
jgi:peptide deformylase